MSEEISDRRSGPYLEPGFATPDSAMASPRAGRRVRKRGRGVSIRFLLVATIFVALAMAVVTAFRDHLDLLIGVLMWFVISISIGMTFVAARRRGALQEAFLALVAASRQVGLPIESGARAFARQCGSRGYRRRLIRFSEEIRQGMPLPDAVTSVRGLIPRDNHASFRAIEATTGSGRAFARLVELRNARIEAISPLINMILYFLVITFQYVIVTSFLLYFIQPKFDAIMADFGMSAQTYASPFVEFLRDRIIIGSGFTRSILSIIAPLAFVYVLILSRGSKGLGLFGLFVPWLTTGERASVLRGLAETFRANAPLDETMRIFADWSLRGLFRRRCRLARQAIVSGVDWVDALAGEAIVRRNEVPLLQAAVRSGNVSDTLDNVADSIQSRQWYRWRLFVDLANPVLTLLMAFLVLLVCWNFFAPLVTLIQGLAT